jgi:hypothetical protein
MVGMGESLDECTEPFEDRFQAANPIRRAHAQLARSVTRFTECDDSAAALAGEGACAVGTAASASSLDR